MSISIRSITLCSTANVEYLYKESDRVLGSMANKLVSFEGSKGSELLEEIQSNNI